MRLVSSNGDSVTLRLDGYQFPASGGAERGPTTPTGSSSQARSSHEGRSWTFRDPCLLTWEAREVGGWLRSVADGTRMPEPVHAGSEDGLLAFTEPTIAFNLHDRTAKSPSRSGSTSHWRHSPRRRVRDLRVRRRAGDDDRRDRGGGRGMGRTTTGAPGPARRGEHRGPTGLADRPHVHDLPPRPRLGLGGRPALGGVHHRRWAALWPRRASSTPAGPTSGRACGSGSTPRSPSRWCCCTSTPTGSTYPSSRSRPHRASRRRSRTSTAGCR